MKKIVKLTENDVNRLVKKVIKEDGYNSRPSHITLKDYPRPKIKQPSQEERESDADSWYKSHEKPKRPLIKQPSQEEIEKGADSWYKSHEKPKRPLIKRHDSDMEYNDFELNEEDDFDFDKEMSGTRRRSEFRPSDREEEIQGVFGSYSDDIPPSVIRYMRKNPDKIIKRLYDVYGDKMLDWLPMGPMDESEEEMVKKTTYTKSEIDQAKAKGVGIAADGTVTPTPEGGLTVTTKQ